MDGNQGDLDFSNISGRRVDKIHHSIQISEFFSDRFHRSLFSVEESNSLFPLVLSISWGIPAISWMNSIYDSSSLLEFTSGTLYMGQQTMSNWVGMWWNLRPTQVNAKFVLGMTKKKRERCQSETSEPCCLLREKQLLCPQMPTKHFKRAFGGSLEVRNLVSCLKHFFFALWHLSNSAYFSLVFLNLNIENASYWDPLW